MFIQFSSKAPHWDSESTYNNDKENKNKNKFIRKFQKTIL